MKPQIERLIRSLHRFQTRLQDRQIQSALLGGLALAIWGRPRMTKDIDLKVLITRDEAQTLLAALGEEYRSLHSDPLDALQHQGLLFVLDQMRQHYGK